MEDYRYVHTAQVTAADKRQLMRLCARIGFNPPALVLPH